jgi:flagellar biosynthesis/type III secretory pathway M-ring protein FliF/YscJ
MDGFLLLVLWLLAVAVLLVLIKLWPLCLAVALAWAIWRWVVLPRREYRAIEARDRLRHEQARREIDRITTTATRAMYDAARQGRP